MNEENYILSEEQAIDAYDDLMVRIAISSYTKLHGQHVAEENEHLRQDPRYQISPQAEKRLRRTRFYTSTKKVSTSISLKLVMILKVQCGLTLKMRSWFNRF